MATGIRSLSAVVLVGGRSRRMGRDKAWLPHPATGQPMLLRQLAVLTELVTEAPLVSARTGQMLPALPTNTQRIHDDGNAGPLGGIVKALEHARGDHLMIIAVDLPNLTAVELQRLRRAITSRDVGAFAQTPRGPQPLVSVVPRNLRTPLQSALADGQLSLRRLFTGALGDHMQGVDFSDETPFQNWNEPEVSEG